MNFYDSKFKKINYTKNINAHWTDLNWFNDELAKWNSFQKRNTIHTCKSVNENIRIL